MSKETSQELSPTDQMIAFLDSVKENQAQWETIKSTMLSSDNWEINLKQSGVDVEKVRAKAEEIELNRDRIEEPAGLSSVIYQSDQKSDQRRRG